MLELLVLFFFPVCFCKFQGENQAKPQQSEKLNVYYTIRVCGLLYMTIL